MRPPGPAILLLALAAAACGNRGAPSGAAGSASAAPPARPRESAIPATPASPLGPAAAAANDANPLKLPPMHVALEAGRRVFTVPEAMLASAKPGSTLVLRTAVVSRLEGDDLVVEQRGGAPYKVHPGYAIVVPKKRSLRPGDPVITEQGGVMRHAVITKFVRDRIGVRYTDLEGRAQEALLLSGPEEPIAGAPPKVAPILRQAEGLAPGNYAALRDGEEWQHVLLVSSFGEGDGRRWFALGFGGAAMVVSEADLAPIPVRFTAKPASLVWAKEGGKMRRATVQGEGDQGLFTVKFERAGRPVSVGWGLLMKPLPG